MLDAFDPDEDLKTGMHKLHGCFEGHREEMRERLLGLEQLIQRDREDAAGADDALRSEVRALGGKMTKGFANLRAQMSRRDTQLAGFKTDLAKIMDSVGAGKAGSTLASLSQKKGISIAVVIAALAAFPGVKALWQAVSPLLGPALIAVNHAMNAAH